MYRSLQDGERGQAPKAQSGQHQAACCPASGQTRRTGFAGKVRALPLSPHPRPSPLTLPPPLNAAVIAGSRRRPKARDPARIATGRGRTGMSALQCVASLPRCRAWLTAPCRLGLAASASSQRSGKSTGWSVGSQRSGIAESVS